MLTSALKSELNEVRGKHQGDVEVNENVIVELRKKIQELEEKSSPKTDVSNESEHLEIQLATKQKELDDALANEKVLKTEIEDLRQQINDTEAQFSKVETYGTD